MDYNKISYDVLENCFHYIYRKQISFLHFKFTENKTRKDCFEFPLIVVIIIFWNPPFSLANLPPLRSLSLPFSPSLSIYLSLTLPHSLLLFLSLILSLFLSLCLYFSLSIYLSLFLSLLLFLYFYFSLSLSLPIFTGCNIFGWKRSSIIWKSREVAERLWHNWGYWMKSDLYVYIYMYIYMFVCLLL